jgi:hypothetical protein
MIHLRNHNFPHLVNQLEILNRWTNKMTWNINNSFLLGGTISAAWIVDDNENKREGWLNIAIYIKKNETSSFLSSNN